jgi:hypothetical protein
MLTIFAIPKAFKGQFDAIQHNAIRSWVQLDPKPEVVLFGDDEGTAEIAQELGLRHIPEIDRNEYGTPLMPSIFKRGQAAATNPIVAYVNSDIILGQDFMTAVQKLAAEYGHKQFLGVGRKTSIQLTDRIDFTDPEWETKLRARAAREGFHVTYDSDFFVFPKGLYPTMPRFAIGRCYWSSWLMYDVRRRNVPMVDLTRSVITIEPAHDYSHAKSTGGMTRLSGVEFRTNKSLFRGCRYYTTLNSNRALEHGALEPAPGYYFWLSRWARATYWIYFLLKGTAYPYSIPLIYVGRWLNETGLQVGRTFKRMRRQGAGSDTSTVQA